MIQALGFFDAVRAASQTLPVEAHARLVLYGAMQTQQVEFLDRYLVTLLQDQFVLVMAIIPALTASSLGQEKERGTLFALFGTQLLSRQILLGKLLGRLLLIVPFVLTTVPTLVFIATFTGRGLTLLIMALVQEAVLAFALGAACLLFGIWVRRAVDATITSYLFLGIAYLIVRGFTDAVPAAFWFDPRANQLDLLNGGPVLPFVAHLAVWVCFGIVCLRLGWSRLRKVCVEQRDRRPSRRLWAFRPAVGNDPFRWRECYVIGLAPLPILRIVPRWLALLAVFIFSALMAVLIADKVAPGFVAAISRIDPGLAFEILWARKGEIRQHVQLMGLVFILLANLLIGVRCGTSVAEEKRRNTWDELLLTAQSFKEITNGKMWGVLQATVPYIIAYTLPVLMLAALGGTGTLLVAGAWIVVPCAIVFLAALLGIDMVNVPADMDETRAGGAFSFEKDRREF